MVHSGQAPAKRSGNSGSQGWRAGFSGAMRGRKARWPRWSVLLFVGGPYFVMACLVLAVAPGDIDSASAAIVDVLYCTRLLWACSLVYGIPLVVTDYVVRNWHWRR